MIDALLLAPLLFTTGACLDPEVGPPVEAGAPDDAATVVFARDIRPLMNRSATDRSGHGCKGCHYSTEAMHVCTDMTGLDLATLGALRKGGSRTRANIVVPGDAGASAIVQKLRGTFDGGLRMPRNGPAYWSEHDIALVERWIEQGATGADNE